MKMEQGNRNWDPKSLSQEFLEKAMACKKYLDEIKTKLHLKRSYEPVLDQTFAELHVFSSLHGKPFLATRDDLLGELRGPLEIDVPKLLGVIDFERFKTSEKKSSKTSSEDLEGMVSK
jgi:hypothetical protein